LFKSTCLSALISFFILKFILKWELFVKWAKFGKKINTHDELQMIWRLGPKKTITRGVSHCGLAIYIKKYLKAKEELCKVKYCTIKIYIIFKNPLKKPKILQNIITVQLISSFNTSQNIIFQKSSYKNRPIPGGQNPLSYSIYSIMNRNTISLRWLVGKANKGATLTNSECSMQWKIKNSTRSFFFNIKFCAKRNFELYCMLVHYFCTFFCVTLCILACVLSKQMLVWMNCFSITLVYM